MSTSISSWQWARSCVHRGGLLWILFGAVILAGCVNINRIGSPSPPVVTTTPTQTLSFPTLVPTATYTPEPSSTPTPDTATGLGEIIYYDGFSHDNGWAFRVSEIGGASFINNRFSLAVNRPNAFYNALSPVEAQTNFYLEVHARAEVCSDEDEFGLMYRVNSSGEHYRFTLTCEGNSRVIRAFQGAEIALIPTTRTNAIFPGVLVDNRLGVLSEDNQFRFFVNGIEVFTAVDNQLPVGMLGLIVRSRRDGQITVSFDDFTVRSLLPTPTPTIETTASD